MSDLLEQFIGNAERAGFLVHRGTRPDLPDAGVSHALYGLADTGSVVLAASPQEPRARSLLPFVHVSLLPEDRILPGLEELFEAVGSSLPSALFRRRVRRLPECGSSTCLASLRAPMPP